MTGGKVGEWIVRRNVQRRAEENNAERGRKQKRKRKAKNEKDENCFCESDLRVWHAKLIWEKKKRMEEEME